MLDAHGKMQNQYRVHMVSKQDHASEYCKKAYVLFIIVVDVIIQCGCLYHCVYSICTLPVRQQLAEPSALVKHGPQSSLMRTPGVSSVSATS